MSNKELILQRLSDLIKRYYSPITSVKGVIGNEPLNAIIKPYGDIHGLTVAELVQYAIALLSPKLPIYSTYITNEFIKKSLFGVPSIYIKAETEITEDKRWFVYINGLMTNRRICENNVRCIEEELNRIGCVNAVANETDSVYTDLLKSIPFYSGTGLTDATVLIAGLLLEKLLSPEVEHCVVIAHSHGCQVMGVVLDIIRMVGILDETKRMFMSKLEVYNISTPTIDYYYVIDELPYIEHIANEYDLVANLSGIGMNETQTVTHDGNIIVLKGKFGHFFNTYYMSGFKENFPESRLNEHVK